MDRLKFVVIVKGDKEIKYVSSPSTNLTANPHQAAVIGVDDIDEVFHFWDIKTAGKADIWMYEEFIAYSGIEKNAKV